MFWAYAAFAAMFMLFLGALTTIGESVKPIVVPFFLLLCYMDFAVGAKRLHDTNRSGWVQLVAIIPVVGVIYLLVACGFLKGTEGDNDYGPVPPKDIGIGGKDGK